MIWDLADPGVWFGFIVSLAALIVVVVSAARYAREHFRQIVPSPPAKTPPAAAILPNLPDTLSIELVKASADDLDVVNAARVSFGQHSDELTERDCGLIGFLMRERHGTPFEHSTFTFRVTAPIAVFREWHRHRVGHSYNEMSGRYVKLSRRFHYPTPRFQKGKPGAYHFEADRRLRTKMVNPALWLAYNLGYAVYATLMKLGVAKEVARYCLPLATVSEMYWTCNARSLMHFVGLRSAPGAMHEIRMLSQAVEVAFAQEMPVTYDAFVANDRRCP